MDKLFCLIFSWNSDRSIRSNSLRAFTNSTADDQPSNNATDSSRSKTSLLGVKWGYKTTSLEGRFRNRWETKTATRPLWKCRLHPLIHTLLKFNLAQDIVNCQGGGVQAGSVALMAGDVKGVADELGIPMLLWTTPGRREKMTDRELRVESLKAVSGIIQPSAAVFGNLLVQAQTIFEWLQTGKDPVVEEYITP